MRRVNSAALALIKKSEGLVLRPYLCAAGVPTIGYGTTKYPDGRSVSLRDQEISEDEAESFLQHDLEKFCNAVEDLVKVPLSDNQFGALVSFTYNVGVGALANSTLLRKLNAGDYDSAADNFLKWTYAGGKHLSGLLRRREEERSLFLHNQ